MFMSMFMIMFMMVMFILTSMAFVGMMMVFMMMVMLIPGLNAEVRMWARQSTADAQNQQ